MVLRYNWQNCKHVENFELMIPKREYLEVISHINNSMVFEYGKIYI